MILTRDDVISAVRDGAKSTKVVFTSGVFDILHSGHVSYLQEAKALGDILVVGINSDESVRSLKGELRPIQEQGSRAEVLSALECVDYVFVFSESNNQQNIKALQPDLYVKAGDYDVKQLSSAKYVEEYGGAVKILSFKDGHSSTSVIDKIVNAYLPSITNSIKKSEAEPAPAIFLDRDGTICKHVDYLHTAEQFELLPGVTEGLLKLRDAGYRLVVITNPVSYTHLTLPTNREV